MGTLQRQPDTSPTQWHSVVSHPFERDFFGSHISDEMIRCQGAKFICLKQNITLIFFRVLPLVILTGKRTDGVSICQ